jgi:Protein of unknown function (DUF3300)
MTLHVEENMAPKSNPLHKSLAYVLSCVLIFATMPEDIAWSQDQGQNSGQSAALTPDELNALVAPIALYPDALVAQVLGAATFPDQIVAADNWLHQNSSLQGQALMQGADAQPWDPGVKALTQFPSVLDNMAKNLSWTSSLGQAYAMQGNDVMQAVQALRSQAYAAGNLKSGSQITVVQQSPQTIVIQPANPQVVYVPQYNPAVVYGTPYAPPGYSTAAVVTTGLLAFGAGIAVGAAISGGCCGWGYSNWNCNWHGGSVVYNNNVYYGNNAWRGGSYGSNTHYGAGYNSATGTYARGASASGPNGSVAAGQAYNPNTGAYAATRQSSNAYGSSGSSVYAKNGQTAVTQHETTSQGSVGTIQTSQGGRGAAATGANGNSVAGGQTANGNRYGAAETANGNKYAASDGNVYKNTGSGWQQEQRPTQGSAESRGWGQQGKGGESSAFSGGGWQSRAESARGSSSRGGGGFHRR